MKENKEGSGGDESEGSQHCGEPSVIAFTTLFGLLSPFSDRSHRA
jgi:hypothetical protein